MFNSKIQRFLALHFDFKRTFVFFFVLVGIQLSAQNAVLVENKNLTISNLSGDNYTLGNNAELRISAPTIASGTINFTSDSAWLVLDGILPSLAIASHLNYITLNGQPAVNNVNVRVTNYLQGSVIIPHTPNFEALTLYKEEAFIGDEIKCIPLKYYKNPELGSFDNTVSSFKLKKGYMVTFAQNENGTGYSKVYIADKADIAISSLPIGLNNLTSFVRVFPWRYTGKKGFGAGFGDFNRSIEPVKRTNSSWFYNWGVPSNEDVTDFEFVTMKSYANSLTDVKWEEINNLNYTSHLLGYNEPNNSGPLNMTVEQQLKFWPKFMESGMRLGSPAPTDWDEFFEFMDKCDELNYRVDFVCIHDYGDGTAETFYRNCKRVYDRTKRPIWITEFNWGGNWTKTYHSYEDTAKRIAEIIEKYDKEGIIERYAIFNFDEELNRDGNFPLNKAVFKTPAIPNYEITPIGTAYRNQVTTMAFNPLEQINFPLKLVAPQNLKITNTNGSINRLVWDNLNYTGLATTFIERAAGSGGYVTVAQITGNSSSYDDSTTATGLVQYNYRLSVKQSGFANSKYVFGAIDLSPNIVFNVALNKSVIASSINSTTYLGEKAVDGDIVSDSSRWVTKAGELPAYIEIDLKDYYLISQLKFYSGYQGYNSPITSFAFQYWNGTSWADIVSETTNTLSSYSKNFTEVRTNKVRLNVSSTSSGVARFYEIEVYGRISSSLAVNEFDSNSFSVYPNPVSTTLTIHGTANATIESIEIIDVNGKKLISKKGVNTIDVSQLSAGIYFLKVNKNKAIKFIKKQS